MVILHYFILKMETEVLNSLFILGENSLNRDYISSIVEN